MNTILVANLIALAGSILMVMTGFLHDNKKILSVQAVMFALQTIANFLLGALTGGIANALSAVRNIYSLKHPVSRLVKILFIAVQVVISFIAGIDGLIGWLPIVSSVLLTIFVDEPDVFRLKSILTFVQCLWLVYDFHYHNYSASIFDVMTIASNLYTMIRLKHPEKTSDNE